MCSSMATTPMTPCCTETAPGPGRGVMDLVSGRRIAVAETAYRAGHVLGNRMLTGLTA